MRRVSIHRGAVDLHPSVWTTIAERLHGAPLFPLLERLGGNIELPNPSPFLIAFSPSISHLSISVFPDRSAPRNQHRDYAAALLQFVSSKETPSNDVLERIVASAPPDLRLHLERLGRFTSLRDLEITCSGIVLDPINLRSVSAMSNLRTLKADFRLPEASRQLTYRGAFQELEQLTITGRLGDIERAIHAMAAPKLRQLYIFVIEERSGGDIEATRLHQTLQSILPSLPASLSSLELSMPVLSRTPSELLSLAEILEPMFPLRNLRTIICKFETYPKDLTDEDVAVLATAWPNLRKFHIGYGERLPSFRTPLTLASLVTLAQHCPHLESIQLPVLDIRAVPPAESLPRIEGSRVQDIHVDMFVDEATADLFALAAVFDRMFPQLDVPRTIPAKAAWENVEYEIWKRVRILVGAMRAGRRLA